MSVPRVTDLDAQITSHVPPRGRVTNHPTGSSRLSSLLKQRQELDAEIAREERILRTPALAEVAAAFCITLEELTGPSRTQLVAEARAVAVWILRRDYWSLTEIGELLDRHHTSVLAAARRCESDAELRTIAGELHRSVRALREAA